MCWYLSCLLASVRLLSRSRGAFGAQSPIQWVPSLQGAKVTAQQSETGLSRTVFTDRTGNYVVLELPVGHYRLQVTAKGFQEYVQDGISLNVNETASVSPHLVVGSEIEVVQVNADADLIEPGVTSMGKVVGERELEDLPLNGRNFSQLGLLQPGVVPITPGLVEAGGGLRDGQPYAVNGQRPESNNFLIDGADNFNGVDGGYVLKPPVDAISEFLIITHNANAEFGRALGSTTNIVTRSGTNSIHGALWEFLRNDAVDARNYFQTQALPLRQNQFGATIGGPIRKDKIFFFGYYEGFRNDQGVTALTTVPSMKERTGNFSELCPEGFTHGFCNNPANQLFNVLANAPYPNNQLPSINPVSQGLLQYFPEPNVGTNLYSASGVINNDSDQFGIKIDDYLTPHDNLNFRYSFYQSSDVNPLSPQGASVPGFPVGEDQRAQNFVAQETHTFSPTLVGVLRFSFLRNKFLYGQSEVHTSPESLGFQYSPSLEVAEGPPFIQISGYTNIGNPITGPRNTYENLYNISGSMSWSRGKHLFKFGGGYQRQQINVTQGIATNGFFVFAPFPVTDAFAGFLSGEPVVFLQGLGNFTRHIRGNELNAYAQDTYKISPRFTLNLGLRYELPMPDTELNNLQSMFIPGRQSVVMPTCARGIAVSGRSGHPRGTDPDGQNRVRAACGYCMGCVWRRENPADIGVWHLLRALLHRSGRPAPDSDQRTAIPGHAAGELAELCRSVQRQSADQRRVLDATDQPHPRAEHDTALHAGLGPEPATLVWSRLPVRNGICRYQGNASAALHRRKPRGVRAGLHQRPADLEFGQRQPAAALFGMHAQRSAEQLYFLLHG